CARDISGIVLCVLVAQVLTAYHSSGLFHNLDCERGKMRYSQGFMPQISEKAMFKIAIVFALYLTSLIASNTLGLKIVPFLGTHISTAIFMFPFVFITTDVIGEVYGRRLARFFVLAGFVSTALFIVYSAFSLLPPWDPSGDWVKDAYNTV